MVYFLSKSNEKSNTFILSLAPAISSAFENVIPSGI